MKIKNIVIGIIIACNAIASICTSAQHTYRRNVLTIDNVAARNAILNMRNKALQPYEKKLESLKSENKDILKQIAELNEDYDYFDELDIILTDYVSEKGKLIDKEDIEIMADFFSYIKDDLSDSLVFSICKEKELDKAYSKRDSDEELARLREKTLNNEEKHIRKGDVSSGLLQQIVSMELDDIEYSLESLNARKKEIESRITNLNDTIDSKGKFYTVDNWNLIMGSTPYPTKTTTVNWISIDNDPTPLSEQISRYVSNLNSVTPPLINGKFDSLLPETLYLIPSGTTKNFYDSGIMGYSKMKIVSEHGTVPELLIDTERFPMYVDGLLCFYNCDNDNKFSPFVDIKTIRDIWEENGDPRDGILLSGYPGEAQCVTSYTLVLDNGKWVNRAPINPTYMTYEECIEHLVRHQQSPDIKQFNYNDPELKSYSHSNVSIFPIRKNWIGLSENRNIVDDGEIFFKTKPYIGEFNVPAKNFAGYSVQKNFGGIDDDAIMVIYENKVGNTVTNRWCDLYLCSWSGPGLSCLNGEYDMDLYWQYTASGIYNFETQEWKLTQCKPDGE